MGDGRRAFAATTLPNCRRRHCVAQTRNYLSVVGDWDVIKNERHDNCRQRDRQQHNAASAPKRTQGFPATLSDGCAAGQLVLLLVRQRPGGLEVPLIGRTRPEVATDGCQHYDRAIIYPPWANWRARPINQSDFGGEPLSASANPLRNSSRAAAALVG